MSSIAITRASPLTTIQDIGRFGMLAHGIGPSGPMDRTSFREAEAVTGRHCGAAIEFGPLGLDIVYSGAPRMIGLAGGSFAARLNGRTLEWPTDAEVSDGDVLSIKPGSSGNFGYLRLDAEIDVPPVLGSRSTNAVVGLGGLSGRALTAGDELRLKDLPAGTIPSDATGSSHENGPIRFIWGIHADQFPLDLRMTFCETRFVISPSIDRMGFRLTDPEGIFTDATILGLVSDAVVAGDIQILGDGTPIVLMADHQPTGGYPRIATIIDADRDAFSQIRPGRPVRFTPVSVDHAHGIARALS
ncbi:biotin-dependent carboxyltransferase family protein [Pelagibacterium luteolum]|uniref:Biotin-dependent carboxylase uncharacterized domain-containing protein n=1 Tax=Pelagibacterium luteolum TaxID=440168 RepID=A0A1G7Z966_9HYPH|nr:biotin-dependent carboxyltransferase family protein [Pelagibacterium luteolum]SDH05281.1 biotin-dependent carboxylase uncharacterized domain-containing protein [Pelagibacterium luteolum]